MIELKKGTSPNSLKEKPKKNKQDILEIHKRNTDFSNKSETELKNLFPKKYFTKYNYKDVKFQLLKDQHGKCAYCESIIYEKNQDGKYDIELTSYGAIEHYRPKGGYLDKSGDSLKYPGYPWLAHSWVNFLYSCNTCNSAKYKGNLFPIKGTRFQSPLFKGEMEDILELNKIENPRLINPYYDDPKIYFKYDDKTGEIIDQNNEKGFTTIECLGLKRFNEERLKYLTSIKFFIKLSFIKKETIEQIKNAMETVLKDEESIILLFFNILDEMIKEGEKLKEYIIKDDARFAGMMRYFKDNNIDPF